MAQVIHIYHSKIKNQVENSNFQIKKFYIYFVYHNYSWSLNLRFTRQLQIDSYSSGNDHIKDLSNANQLQILALSLHGNLCIHIYTCTQK